MLDNWLSPVHPNAFGILEKLEFYQLGVNIRIFREELPDLKDVQVALLGIGESASNAVRQELYRMSFPFGGLTVADLGNVRRKKVSFIIPTIKELMDSKIFPVIIGADPAFTMAQYKAFQRLQQLISLVIVDERIRFSTSIQVQKPYYLNELLANKQSKLFHLGFIGTQSHFTDPAAFQYIAQHHYDCIRLGRARANLAEVEPIIRDGDLLSLNLAALKRTEAGAVSEATPSGFMVEEACQISRYGGMSDKLKSFGIYGFRSSMDQRRQTAQAVAQIIWYFFDGFYHRKNDFPASMDGLVEYIVEFKKMEYQLTFWKSQKSGRWWMQVPVKTASKYQRHRLIPCSYNDYKLACQEELPERLLNAYKRFA
jgi:formiminoglutamase